MHLLNVDAAQRLTSQLFIVSMLSAEQGVGNAAGRPGGGLLVRQPHFEFFWEPDSSLFDAPLTKSSAVSFYGHLRLQLLQCLLRQDMGKTWI